MVRSKPVRMIAKSSAKASKWRIVSKRIMSEFRTIFHSTGLSTPPWGAPASIHMIKDMPFKERFSLRVEM